MSSSRLLLALGVFVCLVAPLYADSCQLKANVGNAYVGTPESVKRCFTSVPFQQLQAKDTVNAMKALVNLYSFSDMAKNSGPPYNLNVDLRGTLATIESKVNGNGYTNDYAFQADLMNMMNPLFDAHTLYRAPGGYSCFLLRPFNIEAMNNEDGHMKYVLREGPLGEMTGPIWKQLFNFDPTAYVGRTVTQLNGVRPTEHLVNFAEKFISTYKDNAVRYNAALRGRWAQVMLGMFPITDSALDFTTSASFQEGDSVVIPNAGFCGGGINSTNALLEANKFSLHMAMKNKQVGSSTKLSGAQNAHFFLHQAKQQMVQGIDVHSEIEQMFQEAVKSLSVDNHLVTSSTAFTTKHRNDASSKHTPQTIMAMDQRHALRTSKARGEKDLANLSGHKVPTRAIPTGTFNPSYLTLVDSSKAGDTFFMKYNDGVNPVRWILKLTTFAPGDVGETLRVINGLIQDGQRNNGANLIIDVAYNGGGIICLSDLLLALLVQGWGNLNPGMQPGPTVPYGIYDFRQSTGSNALRSVPNLNDAFTASQNYLDMNTEQPWSNNSFYNPIPRTRGGLTSNYTQQAYFPAGCVGYPGDSVPGFTPIPYYFKSLVVATDGTCGSACALFASQLQSEKLAYLVSYGGPLNNKIPLSTASFAGGNVLEYNNVAIPSFIYGKGTPGLPPLMSSSAAARFNFNEYYESNELNTPREFLKRPAQYHLPFWATLYNDNVRTPLGLANSATLYGAIIALEP